MDDYVELVKYNAKLSGYNPKKIFLSDKPEKKFYYKFINMYKKIHK